MVMVTKATPKITCSYLQGRMRTMVQLLTGFFRSDYGTARFNMLEDVFTEQGVNSGEAERVLVGM